MAQQPYQGNLQTNFNPDYNYTKRMGTGGTGTGVGGGSAPMYQPQRNDHFSSNDPDVRESQRLTNEMDDARTGRNQGVSFAEDQAKLDMYRGRIGMKNSLAERIAQSQGMLGNAVDDINLEGSAALDSGVKNTKRNFNQRGLLYSGMREGGEQQVRGAVAGQLAKGIAGARRDSANSTAAAKSAYGAVDLANQQESLRQANMAFDTANANNIARLQAMQQLGHGVGYAGGMIAGEYTGRNTTSKPTADSGGGGIGTRAREQMQASYSSPYNYDFASGGYGGTV